MEAQHDVIKTAPVKPQTLHNDTNNDGNMTYQFHPVVLGK